MSTRQRRRTTASALAGTLAISLSGLFISSLWAQPQAPSATAAPAASSDTDAPSEPSLTDDSLPSFDEGLPPNARTSKPTAAEWASARAVKVTRSGPRAKECHAYRVREWVRISCPSLTTASIATLGGDTAGNAFWIDPPSESQRLPRGGEAMFPVRKEERRVIQMLTFGNGYEGPFTQLPALMIQAYWLGDEERPVITVM